MVKITDPNQEKNNTDKPHLPHLETPEEIKLTPFLIKDMIKPKNKQETTPVNVRLDKNIVTQIELYATEHNTTKTEVIKDILTEYYRNKKIRQVSFNLNEPVNLIIPKNKKLINQYIEKEINIITSIKRVNNNTIINPLDPHNTLYNTKQYELIQVNQINNLLDEYNPEERCYYFQSLPKYMDKFYPALYQLILEDVLDEMGNTSVNYFFHRGLLLATIIDEEDNVAGLFIDVICMGNSILGAYIITPEEARELAVDTGNTELLNFINNIEENITLTDLISYNMTNEELETENTELKEDIAILSNRIDVLIQANEKLKDKLKQEQELNKKLANENRPDSNSSTAVYVKSLELKNKELSEQVAEYQKEIQSIHDQVKTTRELIKQLTFLSEK